MWSHIFLFGSLPRRRPPEFTAILMFEFWREATAASVPGLLCQSGRRRLENVSVLSSLVNSGKLHLDNIKQLFACINGEKQWPEARALRYTEVQIQTLR